MAIELFHIEGLITAARPRSPGQLTLMLLNYHLQLWIARGRLFHLFKICGAFMQKKASYPGVTNTWPMWAVVVCHWQLSPAWLLVNQLAEAH